MNELELDEPEEGEAVTFTDAVADPRAVMIMSGYTLITVFAMLAPQRLLYMTNRTVFVFNKQYDFIIFIIIEVFNFDVHIIQLVWNLHGSFFDFNDLLDDIPIIHLVLIFVIIVNFQVQTAFNLNVVDSL